MEKIDEKKFEKLSSEELNMISGGNLGAWNHWDLHYDSSGNSYATSATLFGLWGTRGYMTDEQILAAP